MTHCTCLASDKGPELSAFLNGLEWCVRYNTVVNTSPNGKELSGVENIKKEQFNDFKVTFNEHLVSEFSLEKPLYYSCVIFYPSSSLKKKQKLWDDFLECM